MSVLAAPTSGRRLWTPRADRESPAGRRRLTAAAVGAAVLGVYLVVAVVVWWQVWSGRPTQTLTCGCGDPALLVWSFQWMVTALSHGQSPFFSTAMFHPDGINMVANVSAMLEAFVLSPVTLVFGPVASLNVANTLAPVASAAATYWAARHSLRVDRPAALVAGLMVELSPAVVGDVGVSHLQIAMLAFVPVIGVCLHELLVRQSGRPWRWAALLAAAAVGQFFSGTELLVILATMSAGVVAVAAVVLLVRVRRGSPTAGARARYATRGLAVGGLAAGALLAYPAWYALAGPRHVSGAPWPGQDIAGGASIAGTVSTNNPRDISFLYQLAGYHGPVGAFGNYVGIGAVLVAFAAVAVLWRRPMVWALTALAFVSGWLALGAVWHPLGTAQPAWVPFLPWSPLSRLPVLGSVLAQNFAAVTVVALAALVALFVDRVWRLGRGWPRAASVLAATGLSAAVLLPLTTAWALPLTTQPVAVPAWFTQQAPRLPAGSVVLTYPFVGPPGDSEAMVWQAVDKMSFDLAGGCCIVPGPTGAAYHGTTPGSAGAILGAMSLPLLGPLPALTDTAALATVRQALADWGVTTVVVTDRGRDPAYAVRWFTALLGRPPSVEDGARVWRLPG